jgi:hypothetical protein
LADKLVTIFAFPSQEEANLCQIKLEAENIESVIVSDNTNIEYAGLILMQVKKRDVKRAREILEEALAPPEVPFKFWETWMIELGLGWLFVALGPCLLLFTHIHQLIGIIITILGVILVVTGFHTFGRGNTDI